MTERGSERVEVLKTGESECFLNLSVSGVGFISPQPLSENSRITIMINNLPVDGVVVYCSKRTDGYRVGVKFEKMTQDIQTHLGKMVESFSCGVPLNISIRQQ